METEAVKNIELKSAKQRIILQARDIEIIRCCYEQQFLVHEQIERFYFRAAHTQNSRRRIAHLKAAGFLRSEIQSGLFKHHLLRVTDAGKRIAKSVSPHDVPQAKKVDPATLIHDRIVTDVRLRLQELWGGHWTPEKSLKDKYRQVPDGIFQFEETGTALAVEIENSPKGHSRFSSILNEWSRTEGVRIVLFVATSAKLFDAIKSHFASCPAKPVFALLNYQEFMHSTPLAFSPRGPLDLFSRRTI